MPVWNRAKLVAGAIESVLAQTDRDFELLVVDDGSSDAIEDAVKPYLN
ncbi:MAG: glycosyltransferase family A protein, partial [Acidobacteriota bacterium]